MVDSHDVRHRRTLVAGLIIAVVVMAVYYMLGPESGLYPRCMFRQLTGFDCPGCGSQRAIHALLHGRIAEAWHYNALLLIEIPLIAALLIARPLRHRYPFLHRLLNSRALILTLLATIVLWTIIRNLFSISN